MKKLIIFLITTSLCLGLVSCGAEKPFEKGEKQATLFIATDTHLLSDDLIDEGNVKYVKENLTADGRIQECDCRLMEALVEKVNDEKPDALIFTGDISFNGEKTSHEAFISFLDRIDRDVKVLVIPGNHDFNIEGCRAYYNDSPYAESTVDGQEFCSMYDTYGYGGAFARDENSHSYIYAISDTIWAVMLDSTLCEYNEEAGLNTVGGVVWEETVEWLRPYLQEAKEKGIRVIGFSHHNLTVHNPMFVDNYVMYNSELLAALYEEYGVQLNFSGHLHIQNIAKTGSVYDIAQGGFLDYGNRVGRLDVYDNCMEYSRFQVGDLGDYSFKVFCDEYLGKNSSRFREMYGDDAEEVHLLVSRINAYYFDGDYLKIHELLREKTKAAKLLKKSGNKSYMGSIIDVEKKDQNYLLIK